MKKARANDIQLKPPSSTINSVNPHLKASRLKIHILPKNVFGKNI